MKEIEALKSKIIELNKAYEQGTPLVDDHVYDFLKKKLEILEKNTNFNQKAYSLIGLKAQKPIKHFKPILSLNHYFGHESIADNIKRIEKNLDSDSVVFSAELKVDGISLIFSYSNGILTNIATRGNGLLGEDLSHLKNFINVPSVISEKSDLHIRCEAYFDKKDFENPRNAVAGAFLQKKISENLFKVKFFAHNLYSDSFSVENYSDLRQCFKNFGFDVIEPFEVTSNLEDLVNYFKKVDSEKASYSFDIDGIVIKVNSMESQKNLGDTKKAPKFAFAVKFENEFAFSNITKIDYFVGRFGKVTPVAFFDEVEINKTKIKKATLHNFNELEKKGYAQKDLIKIEMAGSVIPYISDIIEKKSDFAGLPKKCPSCESDLIGDFCANSWNCLGQKKQKLMWFAGKAGLNIKNMGEKQIDFFVDQEILNYPSDFFKLKLNAKNIKNNPKWLGEKSFKNIISSIEESKKASLTAFFSAIGIPNIGKNKASLVFEKFNNFEDFLSASLEDLAFLGPKISLDVFNFLKEEKWIKEAYYELEISGKIKEEDEITLF